MTAFHRPGHQHAAAHQDDAAQPGPTSHHHRARSGTAGRARRGGRRTAAAGVVLAGAGLLVAIAAPASAVAATIPATSATPLAEATPSVTTTIDLLDVNDFHGRLAASPSTPTPEQGDVAGAAVLAGAVDSYRAANPDNTLFVSAGDNVGASTFTSFVQEDQPTIDALNAAGMTVSAIGNHELDRGQDDLRDRIEPAADFDYVSANIVDSATGAPAFDPYAIRTVSGVRVGFIGATTELIPELVSPAGIEDLAMSDIVDSVNAVADDLTDGDAANGEADVLVLLLHEGAATADLADATGDSDFGHITSGVTAKVSAILSGHTHQLYDHEIVPSDGTVPRPVLQAGSYGTYLGHVQMQVDTSDMSLTSITAENVPLAENGFTANAEVAAIVADAEAVAAVEGTVPLGTITGDLRRATQTNGDENRGGESTLGNFVAEVQQTATERNGSQIAFMNPGGLRADMLAASTGADDPEGNVTYAEAAAVQPFANTLVVLDITGAQIKDALEQQWQPDGASRPFLKLGVSDGFSYTYDPTAARGSRITGMTLDGTAIDAATTYKVTVNSFLASGGDNFTAFDGAAAKADSGQIDLQAQVDYFASHPTVTPPLDQRAVGVTVGAADEGGFQPGDEVTVALSSLTFGTAGEQGGEVSIAHDGVTLATAAIDPTIVDTTDEQGRATLTFTVPESAAPAAGSTAPSEFVVMLPNAQQLLVPIAVTAAEVTPPVITDPGTGTGTGALAYTGSSPFGATAGGLLLLLAGVALVIARRVRASRVS